MSPQRTSFLVLALLLAISAPTINADLYGNPSPPLAPPPPFAVKGKTFPPEGTQCNKRRTPCFGQVVTCPAQCPQFKPSDPKAKGCFIDCSNPTCEGVCKSRKPNCEGNGAACYDPRFVGGDGVMFYFHGKAGHHFALVSDPNLQINARFIGLRPAGRSRDFTWIHSLGIRFGPHSLTLSATPAAAWDPLADHLSLSFDSTPLSLPEGHLTSWSSPASASGRRRLLVDRTATVNNIAVTLPGMFEIMATAVPVTKEDDRIHRYGIPADDCFSHLEVQFRFLGLSEKVEGVLGQTYRPDFKSPVKRGVAMPVMGGEDRFATSSLLEADCRQCIFSPEAPVVAAADEDGADVATMDCGGKMSNGYRVVCRR